MRKPKLDIVPKTKDKKANINKAKAIAAVTGAIALMVAGGIAVTADDEDDLIRKELSEVQPEIEYVTRSAEPKRVELPPEEKQVKKQPWGGALSLPLWFASHMATKLVASAVGPVISYVLMALLIIAVVVICLKVIFPDVPLKEILSKKTILAAVLAAVVFVAADWFLNKYSLAYQDLRDMVRFAMGFVLIVAAICASLGQYSEPKGAELILPEM